MEVASINETSVFEALLADGAESMLKFLFNSEWLAWPCEWVSPLQQRAVHGATTVQAGTRLVAVSPAEPLATAAARHAFWSASERVLRKLVKHLELDELGSISSFPLLLGAMIRHFHPDLDDTQLHQALMRRSPERENQLRTVVCDADFKEFLDAKDREAVDKEMDDAARTKKKHASFRKASTPLREKVLKQQKQKVSSMASVPRTRGLVAM